MASWAGLPSTDPDHGLLVDIVSSDYRELDMVSDAWDRGVAHWDMVRMENGLYELSVSMTENDWFRNVGP